MMQSSAKQQERHIWFQSALVLWFDSKDQRLKQKKKKCFQITGNWYEGIFQDIDIGYTNRKHKSDLN